MRLLTVFSTVLLAGCLPLFGGAPLPRMDAVTTDKVDFAPGGTIRIEASVGELNVEGWDEPSVEVTVTRYTWDANAERAKRELDRVQVGKPVVSGKELTLTTKHSKVSGIYVDYRIRVPRDSKLVIRHDVGDVIVYDVAGDIDASARVGGIAVQVPASEHYVVDAKNKALGDIYSDLSGKRRETWVLMGDSLESNPQGATRHLRLRVGVGGITIQKMAAV